MSSGFVSGGTTDKPIPRDDDWLKAQQEIEANRRRKQEEGKQDGGKSLYDVLQQNKAAKQEAFEESVRLKNQFRSLDDDEVEFLDSVLESTRAKEAAVRKETSEQLDVFRKQREAAEKALLDGTENSANNASDLSSSADAESWIITGKKRRWVKSRPITAGSKLRKMSSTADEQQREGHPSLATRAADESKRSVMPTSPAKSEKSSLDPSKPLQEPKKIESPTSTMTAPTNLGLGDYSSDDE